MRISTEPAQPFDSGPRTLPGYSAVTTAWSRLVSNRPLLSSGLGTTEPSVQLRVDDVDLAELTAHLRTRLAGVAPIGYLDGRTALRDAVVDELGCSELEAEELVDTLVARGFAHYEGNPTASMDDDRGWSLVGRP